MLITIHRWPARKPNRRPGSIPAVSSIPATMTPEDCEAEMFIRAELAMLSRRIKRTAGRMTAAGVAAVLEASGP